jgi:thermopsin
MWSLRARTFAAAGFATFLLLAASLGLATGSPEHARGAPLSSSRSGESRVSIPAHLPLSPAVAAAADQAKLRGIRADLAHTAVPAAYVHYPAIPLEGTHVNAPGQPITPLYSTAPAPMGVADIGTRNVGGTMQGYVLNTSSAEGTVSFANAQSVYVDGDGPDMFGVQLNSVAVNVSLFGNDSYQFWCQNFVSYTSSSGQLAFGDNVWNFSNFSGAMSPNAFYAHGAGGNLVAPVYYYAVGPTFTIHYPFAVTFYLNSTVLDGRDAVYFNYTVANATLRTSGSVDYVIFNSLAGNLSSVPPALFQMNGVSYDPIGLVNDIELDLVGNDDGDTTTFFGVTANMTIDWWNASADAYQPVPSAVNSGTDTGETSDGVASYYTSANPTMARLSLGPSFLAGLWNTTTPPGERTVSLTVTPLNAIIMVNPGNRNIGQLSQWVPSSNSGTTNFVVPNTGTFYLAIRANEYNPMNNMVFSGFGTNSTTSFTDFLTQNTGMGVYAPTVIWGNSVLAATAVSGNGTPSNPYTLPSNEPTAIDPDFTQWNDFLFPVFPGLLMIDTTAHVVVTPVPYTVVYPAYMQSTILANGLPFSNNLQEEFWQVSNVTVSNGVDVGGWLTFDMPTVYPVGAIIFWNSSGNLIANNVFADQGQSIALFGGTNNTIWGNRFINASAPATQATLFQAPGNTTGIYEAESGDLLYNNYFGTMPVPAYTPNYNPLSCQTNCTPGYYLDRWNVSRESASVVADVLGTNLTGSIVGTAYQGGNFWWNYGSASDPYGRIPYTDSSWINPGGDYVPLSPYGLYNLTFRETGLGAGLTWSANVNGAGPAFGFYGVNSSQGTAINFVVGNGTYSVSVSGPAGWVGSLAGDAAVATVNGSDVVVDVEFEELGAVTLTESGLPSGIPWTAALSGGGLPSGFALSGPAPSDLVASLLPATYNYTVTATGFIPSSGTGSFALAGGGSVTLAFAFRLALGLTFNETGLPAGTAWTVNVTQDGVVQGYTSSQPVLTIPWLAVSVAASFGFTVWSAGYAANPAQGSGALPANANYAISFVPLYGSLILSVGPLHGAPCANVTVGTENAKLVCSSSNLSLAPGVYSITATSSGYLPYFNNVSVAPSATTSLAIDLVKLPSNASNRNGGTGTTGGANTSTTTTFEVLAAVLGVLAALFAVLAAVLYSRGRRPPAAPTPIATFAGAAVPGSAPKAPDWHEGP